MTDKERNRERARLWRLRNPEWSHANSKQWALDNPERTRVIKQRWNKRNKHRRWSIKLKHRYNITKEQYELMLKKQKGRCAICRLVNISGKRLYVDHDHKCCKGQRSCGKCVRGLLCNNCNAAIGLLRESVVLIKRTLRYLR